MKDRTQAEARHRDHRHRERISRRLDSSQLLLLLLQRHLGQGMAQHLHTVVIRRLVAGDLSDLLGLGAAPEQAGRADPSEGQRLCGNEDGALRAAVRFLGRTGFIDRMGVGRWSRRPDLSGAGRTRR